MTQALVKLEDALSDLKRQPFTPSKELAESLISAARTSLRNDNGAANTKKVRDGLHKGEKLFKLWGAKLIEGNLIVAERLRVERQLGEMVSETIRSPGNRTDKNLVTPVTRFQELQKITNSSRQTLMRWEIESRIDSHDFETWITEKLNDIELSTAAALRYWASTRPPKPKIITPIGDLWKSTSRLELRLADGTYPREPGTRYGIDWAWKLCGTP